jgi:hydroxymethylpyrimidine/phosphomethylpyrimidine kinase
MRALAFLGIRALPVASALTVQNLKSFSELHPVPGEIISKQLDSILQEQKPNAIKVGMLGSYENASLVADFMDGSRIPSVVDPVFASSTGFSLMDPDMLEIYKYEVIPASSLVTPNAPEASVLTGIKVTGPESAMVACRIILDLGAGSVLIKGGHFIESKGTDVFMDAAGSITLAGKAPKKDMRGTGCVYASLAAGHIAKGKGVRDAVKRAKTDMKSAMGFQSGI